MTGLIAFQGPGAAQALAPLTTFPLDQLRTFSFATDVTVAGLPIWIARTGTPARTASRFFCDRNDAPTLWDRLVELAPRWRQARRAGRARHAAPGIAAVALRQRPGPGDDADRGGPRMGREDGQAMHHRPRRALEGAAGVARKLTGFVMTGRGIARHGYAIFDARRRRRRHGHHGRAGTDRGPDRWTRICPHPDERDGNEVFDRLSRQERRRRGGERSFLQESNVMSAQYPDDLNYTKDHEWARIEDCDGTRSRPSASPPTRSSSSATSPWSTCPRRASRSLRARRSARSKP